MIKKILAIAAALASFDASAGYLQYDLHGPVSGYIIQHDDDKSIASYNLYVNGHYVSAYFAPSGTSDSLTDASTHFLNAGPTNFSVYDNQTDYYLENLSVNFYGTGTPGMYSYLAVYSQHKIPDLPPEAEYHNLTTSFRGTASVGEVPVWIAAGLDADGGYGDGIQKIVPLQREVPEPASLGLLMIGALGAAGAMRRRK